MGGGGRGGVDGNDGNDGARCAADEVSSCACAYRPHNCVGPYKIN